MKQDCRAMCLALSIAIFLLGFSIWCIAKPTTSYSDAERRVLAGPPEFSVEKILSGRFSKEFETYCLDQFPLRDRFRTIKMVAEKFIFLKKDTNKLYEKENYLIKEEYPLEKEMVEHAAEKFDYIYQKYLQPHGIKPYISIVPEKNYFMAPKYGYLMLDYHEMDRILMEKLPYMQFISCRDALAIEDYYYTDAHWKQENLPKIAALFAKEMGFSFQNDYKIVSMPEDFYGVYVGQMALPVKPDKICYLTNEQLENSKVTLYDTGKPKTTGIYDLSKMQSKDPYELFLSGNVPIAVIENDTADTEKELVLFRDSFGSSLAPLFVQGYQKITLVDIRYVQSSMLDAFVNFENTDVLFLYSATVINNSMSLK